LDYSFRRTLQFFLPCIGIPSAHRALPVNLFQLHGCAAGGWTPAAILFGMVICHLAPHISALPLITAGAAIILFYYDMFYFARSYVL
jgi:hypothetical protein